ncbi:hypothetical protein PIROE2DRAFT_61063 [Piromyces sp. E2]|nr:hypothetical protein PIROE2DRAFT_61063 [Piromyces sp. E2]|eukprot:OUM63792.1 hypothetical protein PIROE2DRAFT_61063 [Piromyces sp. E2]
MFAMVSNDKKDFGDGLMGLIKLWKFEFNKVLAAHCTTFLIFLMILYIYNSIKSNFEFICSLIGIIIPHSPVITIKDLTENSVELYWNGPIEQSKSIENLKDIINLIGYYISYPFTRYKKSSSSKSDVDNTLSDLISISKQHGEDTYRFSLNNKDTTTVNNSTKLKFPKSTSTTNFKTTHYDKDSDIMDNIEDQISDSNKSLNTRDDHMTNKENSSNDKDNQNDMNTSDKSNQRIGYVVRKGKIKDSELDKNGKILLDGKEVDIRNFATEIKKEFTQLDINYSYERALKNASGFKLFLFKYGFQKRNEITYQVEVNGYILNEENLNEKHIVINGLKPSTSYKIRVWAVMNNRIKSPSSFVNIKTLKSYTESINKAKVAKTNVDEKPTESYEDHLKTIAKIDNDIIEINKEFERLKKQRLEFTKQVNDINDQYREEEIPLRKQLDELKIEKNEVDEVKSQHKGVIKELKEDKRRVDLLKSQREQGLKSKERGKQQLIDRCNRCQTDINKLKKDIQRLEEKEESFNDIYNKAKKEYDEEKEKYMKEQIQLKDKLKEEKKHHRALIKELNDKKAKYKQVEISHKKFMQDNRERNKEKLKVDEEYKILAKKYKELKEKNNTLKHQLKMENKEKIKLLQYLNEIHQQSDSEESSDIDNDDDDLLDRIDSISDDLASNSTLSKSNSDPSTNTPSYSNTNSVISRNSSEENTAVKSSEFNLFNPVEPDSTYEGIQNDNPYSNSKPSKNSSDHQYTKLSKNSSDHQYSKLSKNSSDNQYSKSSKNSSPVANGKTFNNKNESRYNNNRGGSLNKNKNKKLNPVKSSRYYSYPMEKQNSYNSNANGYKKKSATEQSSSAVYERNSRSTDSTETRYIANSPRQKQKQNPKMKNFIPFFSYNKYVPTTETATDSELLSTSLEDDLIVESSSTNVTMNSAKPQNNVFTTTNDQSMSPLLGGLSQANMNSTLSKVSPNMATKFSPQISNLSPLLLNEKNPITSNPPNKEFNSLASNNTTYNSGNQGPVSSSSSASLNTNSLYASISGNPMSGETSSINTNTAAAPVTTTNPTNNLFLFGSSGLGKDKSLNGFPTNQTSSIDNAFSSPRTTNAQLNSTADLANNNTMTGESGLPRTSFSPLISPQSKNSSLMSGFSSIPSYYQNLNMSNDVNDLLGTNSSTLDTSGRVKDKLSENNDRNHNSFSHNTTSSNNYLFNNYFSMGNYPTKNPSESSNKDTTTSAAATSSSYLHDYLNSRLANYQSFYNSSMFNSGLPGGFFSEPTSNGSFNSLNGGGMNGNDLDFNQSSNNDLDDEEIGLNFDYNYELSDSESEDVDTSDIDISKIIDLSKNK